MECVKYMNVQTNALSQITFEIKLEFLSAVYLKIANYCAMNLLIGCYFCLLLL